MALVISIAGTDRKKVIPPSSLKISNVLTNAPDTCEFVVRKYGSLSYAPSVNDEVIITQDGTRIFGGHILEIDEDYDKLNDVSYKVKCIDYTKHIDQKLVVDSWEDTNVDEIIADIRERYMPKDVDIANVSVSVPIKYVAFNYEYPSDCLRQLAEMCEADWYIDYDKKIYFFAQNSTLSPFDLTDTNGKYIYETLRVRRDLTQLRNVIYVRGGEFLGNTLTAAYVAESGQKHYLLPYKFSSLVVSNTGQVKNVGIDPIDDENLYDALHNFQEKMVKFRADKAPTAGSAVRISGRPHLPVLVKMRDPTSIGLFTAREYAVIDKSIQSKEGARQRALAELLAYKTTISEGEFVTYTSGLRSGQRINVQSTLRSIDEDFIINRVDISVMGTDAADNTVQLIYKISMITTRTYDHIQLLQRLLNSKKKEIIVTDDEVLDVVEAVDEDMTISEVVASSLSHNPISEAMSIAETISSQLNKGTEFVAGPFTPSGIKRVFIIDGSRLG